MLVIFYYILALLLMKTPSVSTNQLLDLFVESGIGVNLDIKKPQLRLDDINVADMLIIVIIKVT